MPPSLFDDTPRTDGSPASSAADLYAFLNRAAGPYWEAVRRTLDGWFARYPVDAAAQLGTAFRSDLPGQHWAAWWELYLHELFARLGYEVTVHPELESATGTPDFALTRAGERLYVEATVVFSGVGSEFEDGAPGWLLDAINHVESPDFFVHVRSVSRSDSAVQRLKLREVVQPVQDWLARWNPDEVSAGFERHGEFPKLTIETRGWLLEFEAWPVKAEARGKSGHRVYGGGPAQTGWVDDVPQLRSKLKGKAGRYGSPDAPLVTAVLAMSGFIDDLDVEQALFGTEAVRVSLERPTESLLFRRRDGFWVREAGPQNRRVSAVLIGAGMRPWHLDVAPRTWVNPWAHRPLTANWPFPRATVRDTGEVVYANANTDMRTLFGLSDGWPGDTPFPRDAT